MAALHSPPSPPILLIAGPTASGKSALALKLAARMGTAHIINADAMQVYADLSVVTARPSVQDEAKAPHHMFGHVDASVRYSVGAWARDIDEKRRQLGDAPIIIVGGTGLYFAALTEGLAEIPPISDAARAAVAHQCAALASDDGDTQTSHALHDLAMRVDPKAAQNVEPADTHRLVRILEVMEETGRPISAWRAQTKPILSPGDWVGIVLSPPREDLYARINTRAAQMLEEGAMEEVENLLQRQLDPDLPAMKALGVPQLAAIARGQTSRADGLSLLQRDTRHYAKRQMTWFRGRMQSWTALDTGNVDAAMAAWATSPVSAD